MLLWIITVFDWLRLLRFLCSIDRSRKEAHCLPHPTPSDLFCKEHKARKALPPTLTHPPSPPGQSSFLLSTSAAMNSYSWISTVIDSYTVVRVIMPLMI